MGPATTLLLELGFSLATDLLVNLGERASGERDRTTHAIQQYIEGSTSRIERVVHDAVRGLVLKIEGDRLEELVSRTSNLSRLVRLGRSDQVLHYAMLLRESVDYARNRLEEGKLHWLGAYLAGYSVFVAGLQFCDSASEAEMAEFQEAVQRARILILDHAAEELFGNGGPVPWLEISTFVVGQNPAFLPVLLARIAEPAAEEIGRPTAASASSRVAALAAEEMAGTEGVYLWPEIPPRKLEGAARKLLALGPEGEELIALIDITVFGGAADGAAIFPSGYVYADIGFDGVWTPYAGIEQIPALVGSKVQVDGATLKFYNPSKASSFARFVTRVLNERHAAGG